MKGSTHVAIGILSAFEVSIFTAKPFSASCFLCAAFCSLLPDMDEPNSILCNKIIKPSISKKLYTVFLYIISIFIFLIIGSVHKNIVFNLIISMFIIFFLEKKLKHAALRKFLFTFLAFILALALYTIKTKIILILFCLFIGIIPWLKHRGFTHSLCACALLYFILKEIETAFNLSYLSLYGLIGYSSHILLCDIFTKSGVPLFYPILDKKFSFGKLKVGSKTSNAVESIYIFIFMLIVVYTFKTKIPF